MNLRRMKNLSPLQTMELFSSIMQAGETFTTGPLLQMISPTAGGRLDSVQNGQSSVQVDCLVKEQRQQTSDSHQIHSTCSLLKMTVNYSFLLHKMMVDNKLQMESIQNSHTKIESSVQCSQFLS